MEEKKPQELIEDVQGFDEANRRKFVRVVEKINFWKRISEITILIYIVICMLIIIFYPQLFRVWLYVGLLIIIVFYLFLRIFFYPHLTIATRMILEIESLEQLGKAMRKK